MEIRISHEKAKIVFFRLAEAISKKEYPYDREYARSPHVAENLPTNLVIGGKEHAIFLFCLCYFMRGGIQSDTAVKSLAKLHKNNPEIFDPPLASSYQSSHISSLLRRHGLGFNSDEIGSFWISNFRRLEKNWSGDPKKLFEGIATYEKACLRIKNKGKRCDSRDAGFYGFREKMVSMLAYFLIDSGLIDLFHFPPPVDFHVLRILFANRILTAENRNNGERIYNDRVLECARNLLSDFCQRNQVSPIRSCDSMWHLSRLLCNQHPGNRSIIGKRDGRKTEINPQPIDCGPSQVWAFTRSCGSCPLNQSCQLNIPSAHYYIKGEIHIRGSRAQPPQLILFSPQAV